MESLSENPNAAGGSSPADGLGESTTDDSEATDAVADGTDAAEDEIAEAKTTGPVGKPETSKAAGGSVWRNAAEAAGDSGAAGTSGIAGAAGDDGAADGSEEAGTPGMLIPAGTGI
ncbi:hypothetical protein B5F40_12485 [Gordonibacter sp. An230]|nr:hypothetical protein B5F40_12485 [Gordonibacter sp. An230]